MPFVDEIPRKNFRVRRGTDQQLVIDPVLAEDGKSGKDLTGATVRFVLVRRAGEAAVVSKSSAASPAEIRITVSQDPAYAGQTVRIEVDLSAAEIAGLIGEYEHATNVEDSAGKKADVLLGVIDVERGTFES